LLDPDPSTDPDLRFLGLQLHGGGRSSFELTKQLARMDGRLYGGAAVAISVAAAEAETGRPARWITVQFVGMSTLGEDIECETEVLAAGRRVSQVRVTGRVGERVVFCALGATGEAKPDGFGGQFETMPEAPPPEESPPFDFLARFAKRASNDGFARVAEFRWAFLPEPPGARAGRVGLWARVVDHLATPALLGFVADFVPMAVARAGGRVGAGTSLDNTIRFGPRVTPEWVMVDLDPHLATDGYGHGTVHLWAPDGTLLATGSQTASMLFFE
jgi:acyl-CoA thioesterase